MELWAVSAATAALFGAAALPHLYYYLVWPQPERYKAFVHKYQRGVHPVDSYAAFTTAIKAIQLAALLLYTFCVVGRSSLKLPPSSALAASAALILVGQALNIAIYRAIGYNGVYYGARLGRPVPWCHGFPFNVVAHPQYVGAVLQIWGGAFALWMAAEHSPLRAVYKWLALWWTACYAHSAYVEQYL